MSTPKSLLLAGAAFAAFQVMPAYAQAEDSPGGASDGSGAIIVTARRVEERLQDVPISMTVFNQEQVSNRNMVNVQDLATYTPSLSVNPTFGAENASLALRGFVQDTGSAPTVGAYFADVPAGRAAALTTQAGEGAGPGYFFDLQNVQVLKGPQGTLFGRNTTGGAVLFVPQKPTDKFEGYLEGSYGNYNMWRVQSAINVPLGDTARLRIAGDRLKRDGYLKNLSDLGPRRFNDTDYISLRASFVADLTPELENYIIVSYTHSETNGSVMKLAECGDSGLGASLACPQLERQEGSGFYTAATNLDDSGTELEQWQIINTTTWLATDNLTIKNIFSYSELSNTNNIALFGENFRVGPTDIPVLGPTIYAAPGMKLADQSTLTEELQFQGSAMNGRLNWQAGGYLEHGDPMSLQGTSSAVLINCTDIATFQCTDVLGAGLGVPVGRVETTKSRTWYRSYGLYTQVSYDLTERFKVTGGFRYTWDSQRSEVSRVAHLFYPNEYNVCVDGESVLPDCFFEDSAKSSKPTWLIDFDYKPTEDILLYAKYARGYRAGGVLPTAPRGNHKFDPEKLDAFEVGMKSSFHGAVSGTFNVAAFYNKFSDQQLRTGFRNVFTGSQVTGLTNAGKSRIYGAEVEASLRPFEGFQIDGSYAYLNTKINEIAPIEAADPDNYAVSIAIPVGAPLFYSPKHKLSVTAQYTLPLDESIGDVTFGATYTYTSSRVGTYAYFNDAAVASFDGRDLGTLRPFNLLNLNINWKSVGGLPVDLSAFATNVTGEHYYSGVAGIGSSLGYESFAVGEPRMYGLRIRYRFGD